MQKAAFLSIVLISLLSPCIVSFQSVKAGSKTLVVPDDFPTIMAALGNATEGDTVFVKKGVYHENVRVNVSVSLVGEDKDATVIDGNPPEGYRVPMSIDHGNVTLTGFTLRDGYDGVRVGNANYCNVSGNRITNAKYGIAVTSSSNIEVTDNLIDSVQLYGSGIWLSYSSDSNVLRNRIVSACIGIRLTDELLSQTSVSSTVGNNVSENDIVGSQETAIMIDFSNNNWFLGNNMTNSGRGVNIFESDNNIFQHNNFFNNTVQAAAGQNEPFYNMTSSGTRDTVADWSENYWSDYGGSDANHDGIGDSPYVINEKNADNHPLMDTYAISSALPAAPVPSSTESPSPLSPAPTQTSPSESPSPSASSSPLNQQPTLPPKPQPTTDQTELIVATAETAFGIVVVVAVSAVLWKLYKGKI